MFFYVSIDEQHVFVADIGLRCILKASSLFFYGGDANKMRDGKLKRADFAFRIFSVQLTPSHTFRHILQVAFTLPQRHQASVNSAKILLLKL